MHHTTGFDREEIIDLCIRINSVQPGPGSPNWPPCLGLFKSVVATLAYIRHNRTQAEIGESLGVSQPTISRAISTITPLIPEATREFVPTADDLDPDAQYILDGTLLPCWSWDGHKELYSGKHKTTGMNLQVACTIYGKLAWISDPYVGVPGVMVQEILTAMSSRDRPSRPIVGLSAVHSSSGSVRGCG